MPELPEVETVKQILSSQIIGRKILSYTLLYPRLIKGGVKIDDFVGLSFQNVKRRGKFLIFEMNEGFSFLLHLRMEGKFFYLNELPSPTPKSLSLYFKLDNGYLAFFDTRKFGVMYLIKGDYMSIPPLVDVGDEPFDFDARKLYSLLQKRDRYLKEALLDQTLMSGIGNIYADEILYDCGLSPFLKTKDLAFEDAEKILSSSKRILQTAIEFKGSTISSYLSSEGHIGEYQTRLLVYGRESTPCPKCHHLIKKRFLKGRGTTFCNYCQKIAHCVGITGLIGAGKSYVTSIFNEAGYLVYDCDKKVHELYAKPEFWKQVKDITGDIFPNGIYDKEVLLAKMNTDKKFRRRFETTIYRMIKEDVINYLNINSTKPVVVEAPRLYEAGLEKILNYVVIVVADKDLRYARISTRPGIDLEKIKALNESSQVKKKINVADFIIDNSSTLDSLREKTQDVITKIRKKST